MLGPVKRREFGSPAVVSLDDLVPRDHFSRDLDARLALSFVRDWVTSCYPDCGRPSVDPVVFFKLYLVMFFEGIRSERKLLALASDRLSVWYSLGYDLDEALPKASGFSRMRQRLGLDVFRRFFEWIVDLCQEAGLVWGKELVADATHVPGNAAMVSLVPRLREGEEPVHTEQPGTPRQPLRTRTRIWLASVATRGRPPTRKRSGRATSGWSHCSLRPSSGPDANGSDDGGSSTSTSRRCWSQRGRT